MPNAPGYFADYLASTAGAERTETALALANMFGVTTPQAHGAVGDGVADDTAAFVAAAAAGKDICLPAGSTFNLATANQIQILPNVTVFGPGRILVQGSNTIFTTNGSWNVTFDGVNFLPQSTFNGRIIYSGSNNRYLRVVNCRFNYVGLSGFSVYLEQVAESYLVGNNIQFQGGALVYGVGAKRGAVTGNFCRAVTRGIQMNGGQFNTISGNKVYGGTTGIIFMSFRQIGSSNLMVGNTVVGNQCEDQSEEGISFDCVGNQSAQWPESGTIPVITVTSAALDSTTITMNFSESGGTTGFANGYMAVFATGNAIGHFGIITESAAGFIRIARSRGNVFPKIAAGDKIILTTGSFQNVVNGNAVRGAGTYGFGLWGSAWHNLIANNQGVDCNQGIRCSSVIDSPTTAPNKAKAFSGFNRLIHNTISVLDYGPSGDGPNGIVVDTKEYGTGSPVLAVRNPGYELIGNVVIGQDISVLDCASPVLRGNRAESYVTTGATGVVQANNTTLAGSAVTL